MKTTQITRRQSRPAGAAIKPGTFFGTTTENRGHVALKVGNSQFKTVCDRTIRHANQLQRECA